MSANQENSAAAPGEGAVDATQPKPAVSVIVPMYNVEEFVAECIGSLRAQSFEGFQAICVDDGSTDGSLQVARAAAGDDARFVFVQRPNGGLSAARNTGLDHATGEYVVFLDSDDRYAPEALAHLMKRAQADDLDLLDFNARTFYQTESARRAHREDYQPLSPVQGVVAGQQLYAHYWNTREYRPSACFHLMRRSLLEDGGLRFTEGLLHEDELFTPQLYALSHRAGLLDEPLYLRRMRDESIMTSSFGARNVNSVFRITQLLHAWLVGQADSLDRDFADALCMNIAFLRDYLHEALRRVPPEELSAYVAGLDAQDRIDFNLNVRYGCLFAFERIDDLLASHSYRVGRVLTAAPRALRGSR